MHYLDEGTYDNSKCLISYCLDYSESSVGWKNAGDSFPQHDLHYLRASYLIVNSDSDSVFFFFYIGFRRQTAIIWQTNVPMYTIK